MRALLSLLLSLAFILNLSAEERKGSTLDATIWGGLVYATDKELEKGAEAVEKDLSERLGKVKAFKDYKSYTLLGQHTQDIVYSDFTNWVVPSDNFNLQFETKGIDKKGSLNLMLKLWQDQQVLVKTDATLHKDSPLIIAGPKWRNGRLIFVVVLK